MRDRPSVSGEERERRGERKRGEMQCFKRTWVRGDGMQGEGMRLKGK